MESTKGCYIGQTVAVAIIDEERAVAFAGIVLDIAATGASALVAEDTKCGVLMTEHGARYLEAIREHDESCEEGKEIGIRVKAEYLHPFSRQASQLIVKFRDIAAKRQELTGELGKVVASINEEAKKVEAAKAEEMKRKGRVEEEKKTTGKKPEKKEATAAKS